MLRVLLPQIVCPLTLNRLDSSGDFDAVVLESHAPESVVKLDKLLLNLINFHVSEGLVLNIAINVS